MKYIQIEFHLESCEEFIAELLPAFLGEIGFDSFEETPTGINAFCPKELYSETDMIAVLHNIPCDTKNIHYNISDVEDVNWNTKWEEESFRPIEINQSCCVRPSNHPTENNYQYDIIVNPTQSFGTGYHETTRMVMNAMFNLDLKDKTVLDMGCGTAVLSILAEKLGAKHITAIDIDKWSADNAVDNAQLNACNNIHIHMGDADSLSSIATKHNIVLANINRNILIRDMDSYVNSMQPNAILIVSGFLTEDYPIVEAKAIELGMKPSQHYEDNTWVAAVFTR